MADSALYAGAAMRRLRKKEALTQAAMAARLSISPSYLNLIERNRRPLSARVIVQIVEQFDFDPRRLRDDEQVGGVDGIARRLSDQRFADLDIDREEIDEFLATTPHIASALARLYDNAGTSVETGADPMDASRREIERWRNHFIELDEAAEELADEMRLSRADIGSALVDRLRDKHQIAVRILPREIMPDALRRLDLHARQLQLSEMLELASRNFHIALQLAQLERKDAIANIAAGAQFAEDAARHLFERHLQGYFAAALLMPYSRFLRACEATGYDLPVLMRRFGVSFEQLAHRLTTLQRVGQRGAPFFMARIDRAGQFSKRFAGASGAMLLESDESCPLWTLHHAFERPSDWSVQQIALEEAGAGPAHWLTIARAVEGSGSANEARFAVVVGIEAKFASTLAMAKGMSLRVEDAQPIGMGCRNCLRTECRQRSLPPRSTPLQFERMTRGVTPFSFERQ